MKNRPSILELAFIGLLLVSGNIALGFVFEVWLPIPGVIVLLTLYLWLLFYIVYKSNCVPGVSLYSPLGVIELHINNFAKGNRRVFVKLCAETILYARKIGKPVMFCTGLINKQTLKSLFGEGLVLYKPSLFERLLAFSNDLYFRKKIRSPLVKGIIDTKKIPANTLQLMGRFLV